MSALNRVAFEVFTKPGCGPCVATKKWLENHEIDFVERSAEQHLDFLRRQNIAAAPGVSLLIDGKRVFTWSGYRPTLMAELLKAIPTARGTQK